MSDKLPEFVEIGDSVLYQALQDEIVLLNMTNQEYYGLDDIASDMWKQILEHGNIADVASSLSSRYEADADTIRRDLEALVRDLLATGLLRAAKS